MQEKEGGKDDGEGIEEAGNGEEKVIGGKKELESRRE